MELNIDKCSYDGKWYDFGNGRLKIRAYPASRQSFAVKDGNVVFPGETGLERFKYCLTAWENYVTPAPENKAITLTDEVKKKVYDFRLGETEIDGKLMSISDFVTLKSDELFREMIVSEKN